MEAISARADGELPTIDDRLLAAHIASCAGCRSFETNIHPIGRAASLDLARAMPDLSGQVVRAARAADRGSVWWVLRVGLGVVAVQVIVFSAPALFLGHSEGSDEHAARHLGSFAIAYAISLLAVAVRPAKARGMLPLTAALAGCLLITAVIDVRDGFTPVITEVRHLPEVIGLVLVWLLATRRLPQRPAGRRLPTLAEVDTRDERDSRRKSS